MNLLHSLFLKQIGDFSTVFEQTVSSYLASAILPSQEQVDEFVEECRWEESLFSNVTAIENWKRLLALNIFCHLVPLDDSILSAKIRSFERYPWDQNAQYFRAIIALNHAFSRLPIPEVGAHLLESGAALIDLQAYCPWLSLPYTPQHFEFGIFVCLLSLMCKRDDLKSTVLRIAHWQLNTLNAEAKPLPG